MRILFMGTPDFAETSLRALYEAGFHICGVFTKPDMPQNRGMKLVETPVKKLALTHGTPVFQPASLRDGAALRIIEDLAPDIICVVAYGKILPKEILDYPKYGCVNIHGSILPQYRGAAPIQWAVLNGDRETGVTAMYMGVEMDAGDIIEIRKTEIGEAETSGELFDRLARLGAVLLCDTVRNVQAGRAERTPQNHALATTAPMIKKDLCPIDWTKTADRIDCQVRGLLPWPVATAEFSGRTYKVYKVSPGSGKGVCGQVLSQGRDGVEVACAGGSVFITELQAPGGKRMSAADFLRGHKL